MAMWRPHASPKALESQEVPIELPFGSMRAGFRLHRDFQKRVSRLQQRCDAACAAEETALQTRLSWHAPRSGVSTDTIVQRLYQSSMDKQAQKEKKLRLAEQRQAKVREEEVRRQQQQARPDTSERLYQDHKRRREALERKRQEQEKAQVEWLRLRSVHRRGGDGGVFTKAFSKASPASSLPSTPSTTAPSTPPLSPPGTPGRRKHIGVPRISRAAALAQAAAILRDVQQATAFSSDEPDAHTGESLEEASLASSAQAIPTAPAADQPEGPIVQQVAETCRTAASALDTDSDGTSTTDGESDAEDEQLKTEGSTQDEKLKLERNPQDEKPKTECKIFSAVDSDSDEDIEVEELEQKLKKEGKIFAAVDSDSDEEIEVEAPGQPLEIGATEEEEEESDEESGDESDEESDMEAW